MNLIDIIRWLIAVPLLVIWLFVAFINVRILIRNLHSSLNEGPAPVTIVGGVIGSLGLIILPYMELGDRLLYLWVPLLLDLGSAPFYICMVVLAIWQRLNKNAWQNYKRN